MAKKRRDSKRDPSTAKRVLKAGGTALAIGAGAALFSRTGGLKHASSLIPALADTKKIYNKNLLNKDKTAMNMYEAYTKAVGKNGEVFKETLKKRRGTVANNKQKINYRFSTAKVTNLAGLRKNIRQTANVTLPQELKGIPKAYAKQYATEVLMNDSRFKDKYSAKGIHQVVANTIAKYKEIADFKSDGTFDVDTKFLKRTLDKYGISEEDGRIMISKAVKAAKDSEELNVNVGRKSVGMSSKIEDIINEDIKSRTNDNLFLNKLGKRFGFDHLGETITGYRYATLDDVLNNLEQLGIKETDFNETINNLVRTKNRKYAHQINSLQDLRKLKETDPEAFGKIIFDKNLKVKTLDDGSLEFLDLTALNNTIDDISNKLDSSIVGRIFTKGIDRKGTRNAPKVSVLLPGMKSATAHLDGVDDGILREAKVIVNNKLFGIDTDDAGNYLLKQLANEDIKGHSINMRHGSFSGVLKTLLGSVYEDPINAQNKFLQLLDFGQNGRPNIFNRIYQWFNKFDNPDWERNIINDTSSFIFSPGYSADKIKQMAAEQGVDEVEIKARVAENFRVINEIFKNKAGSIIFDDDAVQKFADAFDEQIANNHFKYVEDSPTFRKIKKLIDLALSQDSPEDVLDQLQELDVNGYHIKSKGLGNLINRYKSNAAETLEMLSIESKRTKKIPVLSMEIPETNVTDISGIVRREILKEITAEEDYVHVIMGAPSLDFTGQEFDAFAILNQWQKWESLMTSSPDEDLFTGLFSPGGRVDTYLDKIREDNGMAAMMSGILSDMRSDYGLLHKGTFNGMHEMYAPEFNKYDFIPQSKLGLNQITQINSWTKFKAAMKELNAGRKDTENITPATLVTQYMIQRLSTGVEESGLGLSYRSMASPLDTIKNMMLKRVLPAMAAYTAIDYLNDTSQDVFGVGIDGAMANVAANFDVAGRKLAYSTGIGQALDWVKRTSVIGEYWTGSTDFQTAEERREWYKDGYTPVRKSRFWGFGSSSEFRGGDISFFQPNYLRRIHSDYKDKVLYGSNSEKWAHSIVPTPTHPLSTIRYLMDPYWLERKHIDDAPTPLTGKMFSEGSFWGAILNPTIGEVIKPQIMLPEIKKRMTGKGHDVKGIIRNINERIKSKGSKNDDLLVVNGTDIRNATYVPYGNATPGTLTVNQNGEIRGIQYMEHVQDIEQYRTPDGTTYTERGGGGFGPPVTHRMEDGGVIRNTIDDFVVEFGKTTGVSQDVIANINAAIKNRNKGWSRGRQGGPSFASQSPDASHEGTYYYNNLVNEYNTWVSNYYSNKIDPTMISGNKFADYAKDAGHSLKNLSGIYGFAYDQLFGENSFTVRYENAGSYSSFSRGFWDAGIGGLGGGAMEIARHFFPSADKSRIDYNPLVNNMPEWLPEKFRTGVPWTKITKGEMRLPGKGYEALNELHPDEFADENGYGSFDKFKILADVAPNSNEYKVWRNIVKHNIKDPELKQEIKEIEARTKRMSGSHEFYDYQYLKTNTEYQKGVVKEVNDDGTVVLANNQILHMAGIEFNENYGGELNQFLKPGQHITYRTETTPVNDPMGDGVIRNAAIYVRDENINKKLMDMGVAERDMSDTSSIGNLATISSSQEAWGGLQELIAHARIPIIHNKLMHIETPLESFVSEQVNGANFQTWDHPIQGFVMPMLNEVAQQGVIRRSLARGYRKFHYDKVLNKSTRGFSNAAMKFGSGMIMTTLDPAAMLGGTLGFLNRLNNGRNGDGRQKLGAFSRGAKIGGKVGDAYWAWTQADNPLSGAIAFGALAGDLYQNLKFGEFAEKVLKKSVDLKGAIGVGAAVGVGVSMIKNSDWDKDKLFKKHMPKKYKKINELNEYFDRLEYVKYKGLYEAAARKASLIEGTDIKGIFKELDKNKEKIAKLKRKAEKLLEKHDEGDSEYKNEMAKIQRKIDSLQEAGNNMFVGGKYTKSAVAYKKAMESTIYGLKEGATKDEILAAIPDQYKDYFQKFMEVRDPDERKKILKYMPDYLQRPLQLAWGMKMNDVQSNRRYFKSHKLPSIGWKGWKPNINLKHVQMKTIENEGMLLADFGFYDSEKGKAAFTLAPDIDNYDRGKGFSLFDNLRLLAEMKGLGLGLTNVSIEKTSAPGVWIGADIKQNIEDRAEVAGSIVGTTLQSLAANFI